MATRYDEAYYQRKIEGWEESLLDFSMRNKLLNLKTTPRSGALAMSEPGWDAIWERLACSGRTMQFPTRTRADYERELKNYNDYLEKQREGTLPRGAAPVLKPRPFALGELEIMADVLARDMQRRLRSIRQRARLLREERGLDTLYLAFGTVRWRDLQNKPHDAPAVLLPVELDARSRSSAFTIKSTGEAPSGNVTFRLYAKDNFDLDIPEFDFASIPTVDELAGYLDRVERTVQPMGWRVERTVALSVFSFANISMYRDLVDNADAITSHPVVRAICGDTAALRQQERDLAPIDEVRASSSKVNPGESFQVVDADSSQEYAIQLANAGYSFVLQGPPGTGKSQTITNIISEAIARGKTVLFVSEKRAALDVVYTRLEQAGLKDYVYVLHDVNQNKKEAIKDLAKQLESKGDDDALDSLTGSSAEVQRYELDRASLDGYAAEMTEVIQPFNKSIWDVCNELIRLQDQGAPVIRFSLEDVGKLSDREFAGMRDAAGDLGHARGAIKGPVLGHPWHGVAPHAMTEDFKLDAQDACINYLSAIDGLLNALDEADQLGTKPFDRREGAARSLASLLKHLDGASGLEQLLVSPNLNRIRASLKRLESAKSKYSGRCNAFEDACSEVDGITYGSISPGSLELLAAQLNKKIAADPAFKRWDGLSEQAQGQLKAKVQELEGELREVRAVRDEILRKYSDDVLDIDARSMLSDFEGVGGKYSTAFARAFSNRNSYRKACDQLARCRRHWSKDEITYEEACALLHQLEEYESKADQFEERGKEYERWFPGLYNGLDTDTGEILARIEEFDTLQNLKDSTSELLTILHSYEDDLDDAAEAFGMDECGLEADFSKMVRAVDSIMEIRVSTDDLAVDVQKLVDMGSKHRKRIATQLDAALVKLDAASGPFTSLFLADARPESDDLLALRERVEGCAAGINDLEYMMSYARNRSYCCMCGLGSFVAAAEREDLSPEGYVPAFERRAYVLWFEEVSKSHSAVAEFSSAIHEDDRREFCECDESLLGQTRQRVIARVHASLVEASDSDEAQTLKREANKRTRVWPVRKVFSELPELACKLKPCMMMSPLSVSTFLESRSITFDLVVFDEASQVRTEDAVGAISRGRQAIIAGDSHQLPPTSFFETTSIVSDDGEVYEDDEDDAAQIGAFDSVLEEAAALHAAPLNLHYRSRNESLISFSNDEIYDGRLVTFPSSYEQRRGEGVSFAYVPDGVWRGARSGNPVEARRVAELVFEHFKKFPERSVGVIALGSGQAQLIDDEIDTLRAEKLAKHNHSFEKFFNENRSEPFFVKNLENVQGDERDSIFLSVGYGKNFAGKLIQNFGPINQKGGERRLNVAVTRAKHDLTLVSSMKGSDISVDTASRGPQLLHDYLEYAERCEASGGVAENRFVVGSRFASASSSGPYIASYIERELKERGYAVDRSIGTSICRIDLGVKRDAGDTDYLLGILLDGSGYAQTDSARDRERIQPEMLQGMGWDLYRVWVQDWERHPEKSMEELLSRVDELAADYVDRHPEPRQEEVPAVTGLASEELDERPDEQLDFVESPEEEPGEQFGFVEPPVAVERTGAGRPEYEERPEAKPPATEPEEISPANEIAAVESEELAAAESVAELLTEPEEILAAVPAVASEETSKVEAVTELMRVLLLRAAEMNRKSAAAEALRRELIAELLGVLREPFAGIQRVLLGRADRIAEESVVEPEISVETVPELGAGPTVEVEDVPVVPEEEPASEAMFVRTAGPDEEDAGDLEVAAVICETGDEPETGEDSSSETLAGDAYLSRLGEPDENGFYPYVEAVKNPDIYDSVDDFIYHVLLVEAPLAMTMLERYVSTFIGHLATKSDEANARISLFMRQHEEEGFAYKASFVYVQDHPVVPRRRQGKNAYFSYIAPEELEEGLLCILERKEGLNGISPWLLKWHTYEAFGFNSLNAATPANRKLSNSLNRLRDAGRIQIQGDTTIRLAEDERRARSKKLSDNGATVELQKAAVTEDSVIEVPASKKETVPTAGFVIVMPAAQEETVVKTDVVEVELELEPVPEPLVEPVLGSENGPVAEAENTDEAEENSVDEAVPKKARNLDEGQEEAPEATIADAEMSEEAEAESSIASEVSSVDEYLSRLGEPDSNGFYQYVCADRTRSRYASVDDFIREVLLVEAPVAMTLLEHYVSIFLGREATGTSVRTCINDFLRLHLSEGFLYKAGFLYVQGRAIVPRRRSSLQYFSYISPEEVDAGLLCTLKRLTKEGPTSAWALKCKTYEAFGYRNLTVSSSISRQMDRALEGLQEEGQICISSNKCVYFADGDPEAAANELSDGSTLTSKVLHEEEDGAHTETARLKSDETASTGAVEDVADVSSGTSSDSSADQTSQPPAKEEAVSSDDSGTATEAEEKEASTSEGLAPESSGDSETQNNVSHDGADENLRASRPEQVSIPHHILEWSSHRTLVWNPGKPNANGFFEYKEADKTPSSYSGLDEFVYTVLWTEAPIALETLYSYAFEFFGRSLVEADVRREVRGILEAWSKEDICSIWNGFVYITGRTILPRRSSKREFRNIAPKELSAGTFLLLGRLDKGSGVAPWILKSRTYEAFGYDNLTVGSSESNLLQDAIRSLERAGRARSESGLVHKVGSVEEAAVSTASNAKPKRVTTSAEKPAAQASPEKPATSGKGSSKASKTVKAQVKTPERSEAEPPVTNSKLNTKAYISNLGEPDKNGFYRYVEADKSQGTCKSVDEFIRQVLVVEAPIAMTLLKRYVSTYMRSEMVSDEVNGTINDFLARHSAEGFYEDSSFVYLAGRPVLPRRRTANQMYFSYIAPEELEVGLLCVLERQPKGSEHTAWRIKYQTYEAFGFSRLSSSSPANRRLNNAIDRLLSEGAIRVLPNGKTNLLKLVKSGKGSWEYAQGGGVQRAQASATGSNDASTKVEPATTTAKESPRVPTKDEAETVSSGTESTSPSAAAEVNSASRTVDSAVSSPEFALAAGVYGFVEYVAANKSPGLYKSLDQFVHKVLWTEAPLALEVLFDYSADYLKALPEGAYMKQADVRKAVRNILDEWKEKNICETREGFVYLVERPVQPRYGGGRTFKHIPLEELDVGVLAVLRSTDGVNGLKTDDLVSSTAMAFGFVQTDEFMRLRLRNSINRLYKDKQVDIDDGTVCLHGRAATETPKAAATTAQQNPGEEPPKTPERSSTTTSRPARQKAKQPVESPEPPSETKERQAAPKKTESESAAPAKAAGKLAQGEAQTVEEEAPVQTNPVDIKDESQAVKEQEPMKTDADELPPASTNDSAKTGECASEASNEPDENGFYEYRAAPRQGRRYLNKVGSYAFACEIIETEAPISKILLQKYMRDYMGHRSVDSGVRGEVVRILDKGHDEAKFEERDGFIYVPGREILPRHLGPRDFNDVAPEEVDAGLVCIMERNKIDAVIGDKDELNIILAVSNAFGSAALRDSYAPIKEAIVRLSGNQEPAESSEPSEPAHATGAEAVSRPDDSPAMKPNEAAAQFGAASHSESSIKIEQPALRSCEFKEYEADDRVSYKSCVDFLAVVVRKESPIEFDALCKRYASRYLGYSQVSPQVRRKVNSYIGVPRVSSRITRKEESNKEFLYWDWSKNKKVEPRHGGDRNIADIAPEEREAGLLQELQYNKECSQISRDNLVRLTRESFGCVDSRAAKDLLNASIDSLANSGRVFVDEAGMVSLCKPAETETESSETIGETPTSLDGKSERGGEPSASKQENSAPEVPTSKIAATESEPEKQGASRKSEPAALGESRLSSSTLPVGNATEKEPTRYGFIEYKRADVAHRYSWSRNDFILEAIRVEAPLSIETLYRYTGEYTDHPAASDFVHKTVNEVIRSNTKGYFINGAFVYKRGTIAPRYGGGRSIKDIAPEELRIGMIQVLKRLDPGSGVEADLLINKTYEAFTDMPVGESIDIEPYLVLDDILIGLYKDNRIDFVDGYASLSKPETKGAKSEPTRAQDADSAESVSSASATADARKEPLAPEQKSEQERGTEQADASADSSAADETPSKAHDAEADEAEDAENAPEKKRITLRVSKNEDSMSSHSFGKRK